MFDGNPNTSIILFSCFHNYLMTMPLPLSFTPHYARGFPADSWNTWKLRSVDYKLILWNEACYVRNSTVSRVGKWRETGCLSLHVCTYWPWSAANLTQYALPLTFSGRFQKKKLRHWQPARRKSKNIRHKTIKRALYNQFNKTSEDVIRDAQ